MKKQQQEDEEQREFGDDFWTKPETVSEKRTRLACGRKVKMLERESAELALKRMSAKGSEGLVPYLCENCGYWHLGHPR